MDKIDQEILRAIQDGIPLLSRPFAEVAKTVGMRENELIIRLKKLKDDEVIRRFGASINPRKVGITANGVVVWKVPQNRVKQVTKVMSSHKEITHCYERQTIPKRWEYNLFTVTHGRDRESVKQFVKGLSEAVGIKDYLVLFSTKKFKGTSTGRVT